MIADIAGHMPHVAKRLLGDPNPALSNKREWRYGTHGSLSINLEKGTWFDHENMQGGGVLSLIERELKITNGVASEWLRKQTGIELSGSAKQPIAEYPYTDENGGVLFEVCRFEPKDFRQRRPDGRGGWIWNLGDVRRVLFHLSKLLEANNRTIYIAEGEKDVLALERLKLVATCNPGGAGKWRAEYCQYFRGADVVILPDNDPAGEDHAKQVATALRHVAENVRIVRLPNLPPKGDVSDWIAAGGTAEKLEVLCLQVDGQPEHEGDEACLTLAQWANRDIPEMDRLIGYLLNTTTRLLLVAATGLGKTNFAMALGFHIAAGQDFLRWKAIRPARVLFIDGEMSRRLMKIRLADAARRLGARPGTFFALCRDDLASCDIDMPSLNTEQGQVFIDAKIAEIGGVDLVIFDNIQSLINGDMRDEESWQQTLPWVKSLTARNIGQIWVHHTGHDKTRAYGTSTREWQLDTVALMEPVERPGTDIAFNLKFDKARERTPDNRADFEPAVITLEKDQWAAETASPAKPKGKPPSPAGKKFHGALLGAIAASGKVNRTIGNWLCVTMSEWQQECHRRRLIDPDAKANSVRAMMSKYRLELIASNSIACDGECVWDRCNS